MPLDPSIALSYKFPQIEGPLQGQSRLVQLQQMMQQQQMGQMALEGEKQTREALAQSGGDIEKAISSAIQSGNYRAAHQLAPLLKIQQDAAQRKALAGGDMNDPEYLRKIGLALGKPEFVTHAERIEKQREEKKSIAALQDQTTQVPLPSFDQAKAGYVPGKPFSAPYDPKTDPQPSVNQAVGPSTTTVGGGGALSTLMQSPIPAIANHARILQARINSGAMPLAIANQQIDRLAAQEGQFLQAQGMQATSLANRPAPHPVAVMGPDGKPVFVPPSQAVGMQPAPTGAATAPLEADALGPMAWEKLLFGTNPPGMGNASAAQRAQVNAERARLGKAMGLSDMEMAMLPQDNKVKMKAVDTLTKWGATVARSAEKLDLDLGVAIDYAKKLPLGRVQIINKGVIAGLKEFNDPDANAYAAAINSVRQEYARLMSGPTSNAMLPVEAMKIGGELLSKGVDVPSLVEVGNQMRRDAANTITASNNQINTLRGSIMSLGTKPSLGATESKYVETRITPDGRKLGKKADGTIEEIK